MDAWSEDEGGLGPSDLALVRNLRRSNTRRLLGQLVAMPEVHFDVWFTYLSLLFFRLGPEVNALLKEDKTLRTACEGFVDLWGSQAAEALRNILAGSKN